jgi:inner membrane protein
MRLARLWPFAAVALVLAADAVLAETSLPQLAQAPIDEAGHLATACLLLGALWPQPPRRLVPSFLTAAVVIDVDHVPFTIFGTSVWTQGVGRPYTHSLLTVLVLVWTAALLRSPIVSALAAGVCAHFVRDVSTGPGLALGWPMSDAMVRLPYAFELAVVILLGAIAWARAVEARPTETTTRRRGAR